MTVEIMIVVTACVAALVMSVAALVMALPGPKPTPRPPAVVEIAPSWPTHPKHAGPRASHSSGGYTARHATPRSQTWRTAS